LKLKEDFKEWRKRAQEKIKGFKQNKITEDLNIIRFLYIFLKKFIYYFPEFFD
jgi:hypothetical protein